MKSYIEKVISDPFYKDTYKYLGKASLPPAGFLYDKNQSYKSLLEIEKIKAKFSSINIHKIIENIEKLSLTQIDKIKTEGKAHILLSTGSFNPIHEGHIKMMDLAKEELNKNNMIVLGGFLSASHDGYVFTKDTRFQIPASQRLMFCDKLIISHPFLSTDKWEALENDSAINFTDVILYLEWSLNKVLKNYLQAKFLTKIKLEIVYVFGSDNFTFMSTFISKGMCVCVPRSLKDFDKCIYQKESLLHFNLNNPTKRIFIAQLGEEISSSQIRNNEIEVSELIKNDWKTTEEKKLPYLIRNDIFLSSKETIADLSIHEYIKISLLEIFSKYVKNIIFLDVNTQLNTLNKIKEENIINLDAWTFMDREHKLRVSRIFHINSPQIYSSNLYIEDKEQLQAIKNQKFSDYVLVDDDIATGFTVNTIIKELSPKKCIKTISLNPIKDFYDIIDARDFIFGSQYGGLMCLNPFNNKAMRVPYIYPFVNLYSRAKLPFGKEKQFSYEILEMNINVYKNSSLKIKDLNLFFQNFCEYLEISKDTLLIDMLKRLKNEF